MPKVILVHGFSKNSKDMKTLEHYLEELGYECMSPNLPLTYKEFDFASSVLEGILEEMVQSNVNRKEKIHLVGHSTGGLVIRHLITETKFTAKIGRCVLIATPNNGSKLAAIAGKVKPYTGIYKTLHSLNSEYIEQLNLISHPNIEIAAIAGNKRKLLLGHLINDENDGRVATNSVYLPDLKDFLTLPYGHKEIHHQEETAKWVDAFLRTGKFK